MTKRVVDFLSITYMHIKIQIIRIIGNNLKFHEVCGYEYCVSG